MAFFVKRYSGDEETGREVGLVSARLKAGETEWPFASVFLNAPDRCQCCVALYYDKEEEVMLA